ncbi:hypothetical protein AWC38_SpisGene11186 [Stylophora pistillata]|uniref:Death domain-containing protein n=1 Tax=Stylophora pistillata TaxID=50429 RepID=A0A2B4S609_STYPI|nr:hypothetical protein AWC38_SpisGene11186 [Stylophora pistillata]
MVLTFPYRELVSEEGFTWILKEEGVFIKFLPKAVPDPRLVTCSLRKPGKVSPPLEDNESLCLRGYELVMKEMIDTERWRDLETPEVIPSDLQGESSQWNTELPFVHAKVTSFSRYAVICRLKSYKIRKEDSGECSKIAVSVPEFPGACLSIPESSFPESMDFVVKVQEVSSDAFEGKGVLVGPVVHIKFTPKVELSDPSQVSLNCPVLINVPIDLQERQITLSEMSSRFTGESSFEASFSVCFKVPTIEFFKRENDKKRREKLCCLLLHPVAPFEDRSPVNSRKTSQSQKQPPVCEPSPSVESPVEDSAEGLGKTIVSKRIAVLCKEDMGNCWKDLGTILNVPESEVRNIEVDYFHACDKGFAVLQSWRDREGNDASVKRLVDALIEIRMKRNADHLLAVVRKEKRRQSQQKGDKSEKYQETCGSPVEDICSTCRRSHGELTLEVGVVYDHEGSVWERAANCPVTEVLPDIARLNASESYAWTSDAAFGMQNMTLNSGEKVEMPNVIRTVTRSTIVAQYKRYCEEEKFVPTSRSTKFRILEVWEASQRKSLSGLDNAAFDGVLAFSTLEKIISQLGQFGADKGWVGGTLKTLRDSRLYLKQQPELVFGGINCSKSFPDTKVENPKKTKAFLRLNDEGCYRSDMLILACNDNSKSSGVHILGYDFSESQRGKYICDRIICPMKSSIKNYCNERHDILSAVDMHSALKERPVTGVTASVEHIKAYLTTKFDFGIVTGNILSPKEVAEDMRRARNEEGDFILSMALKLEDGQDYSSRIQIPGAAESSLRLNDLNSYRLAPEKKSLKSLDLRTIKPDLKTIYSILCDKEDETGKHQASEREGSSEAMSSTSEEVNASRTQNTEQSERIDETGSEKMKLDELRESLQKVREMDQAVTRIKSRVDELPRRQQSTRKNEPFEMMRSLLKEVDAFKEVIEQNILERMVRNENVEGLRDITEKVRKARIDLSEAS